MTTDKIGRYEIKTEIARGGMATVIHAYDPRFERDVAIKILPQAFLHDPQFRVRFDREAKMIALLEHPAIVPVYDFGEEEGQPYIVMRYMSGGSLTERIEEGALSVTETSQMVTRLAPGLDAAHARNIIHRDLKPGNILFDQYGNAYLSDFGIARISEGTSATITGTAILGTPAYMSPEQVQGDKEIDGRSDIYAMGVLIYQMLTGQTPYSSDTPGKVMMMHVLQPVPDITQVTPDLPDGCNELIQKAMAKDPDDRFANTGELAAALENVSKGMPVSPSASAIASSVAAGRAVSDSERQTVLSPGKTVVSSGGAAVTAPRGGAGTAEGALAKPARSRIMTVGLPILLVLIVGLIAVGALAFMGQGGSGPLAFLAPASPTATPSPSALPITDTPENSSGGSASSIIEDGTPTATSIPPTDTPIPPTPTETASPTPALPVIGGADKIAYLSGNNLFTANLDGTDLVQYTEDHAPKFDLQWAPDGQHVDYISGKCVYTVNIETKVIDIIACFNFTEFLKLFEISPSGKQVAMSIDNQLYIIPYDLEKLSQVERREDLTAMAECEHFAPYLPAFVKFARWSRDETQLAMVIMGTSREIGSADTIQIIPITECVETPKPIDNFPPPRYYPEEYRTAPTIQNFGWDGYSLFAHATFIRTGGFGNLHIYNTDLHKANIQVNPLDDGSCCYRDPQFSPDGTQLMFAYQMHPGGENAIQIYIIPYGTIGTGLTYEPLPLPSEFDPKEWPQPALRPTQ